MFDNIKNMGNIMSMLGNAKELKGKMEQMQDELAHKTVEAESGAGAVRVVMNGKFEVISLNLDRPLMLTLAGPTDSDSEADTEMIEDLIAAAVNAAFEKARRMVQQEMSKLTGGLNLPGLDQLTGG